jgi:hypothetical protein
MIKDAREKLENVPEEMTKEKVFFHGEFEETLKKIKGEFDAAIFMGGALAHNPTTYKRVLEKTAKALPQKSVMVIQLPNFEKILKIQKGFSYSGFQKNEGNQEHAFVEFYNQPTNRNQEILKTFSIFDFDGKAWKFYGLKSTDMAYITQEKLHQILRRLGYRTTFFGGQYNINNWDRLFSSPFEVTKSDWLNVLAVRK